MNRDPKERILLNEKEQTEDFLEDIYLLQGKFAPLTREDICKFMDMTKWEYKRLVNLLKEEEYIRNGDGEVIILTEHGKMIAEDNACRMEHVISPEIFCGITDYMKTGKSGDRNVHGWDINRFYDNGSYEFRLTIYEYEKRYPRIISPENNIISSTIRADVGDESYFELSLTDEDTRWNLFYRKDNRWISAGKKKRAFRIPTDIFMYTLCEDSPMVEGEAEIALTEGEREPEDKDIREANVHLW